jgi:N6-adenosine-specific RNA methylase IME4
MEAQYYFIDDIVIPRGRRKASEERVKELAESIEEIGQLQPILIVENHEKENATLVAGLHRLMAFKMLNLMNGGNRDRILAISLDLSGLDAELAEIDENLVRFELSAAERAKLMARRKQIYLAKYPETGHGKLPGAKGKSGKNGRGGKVDKMSTLVSTNPSFAENTSSKIGKTSRSVRRDVARGEKVEKGVLERISGTDLDSGANLDVLIRLSPEYQKELVDYAEDKGIVNLKVAKKSLEKDKAVVKIKDEAVFPEGPFRVIVSDPPWPYERINDPTHRGSITYHPMTIEDICELPVQESAHDDCILWLWTTNSFLHEAYHVIEAWGFEPKTVLTWKKPRMGVGNWLRNITEHCIVAIKGKPVVELSNQTTFLEAPAREHSRKPEEFYRLVEELCPGAKLEMFAREQREDWIAWGSETDKFDKRQL